MEQPNLLQIDERSHHTDLTSIAGLWGIELDAELWVKSLTPPQGLEPNDCPCGPDLIGENFLDGFIKPTSPSNGSTLEEQFSSRAQIQHITLAKKCESGLVSTFLINGIPKFSNNGTFTGYSCSLLDVTTVASRAEEPPYYEAMLSTFINNVPSTVVIKDVEGRFIAVNPLAERNYGVPRGRLIGRCASDVLPGDVARQSCREDSSVLETEAMREVEESYDWPDGVHTFHTFKFPIFDSDQCLIGSGAIGIDLTPSKRIEQGLLYRAYYDSVTGLPNNQLAHDRLSQAIAAAKRFDKKAGVLVIDLNYFRETRNADSQNNDEIYLKIARALKRIHREIDTVARLDETTFCVVLSNLSPTDSLQAIADKTLDLIRSHKNRENGTELFRPAIGMALSPDDSCNASDLMQQARLASKKARKHGQYGICRYDRETLGALVRRREIEATLFHAAGRDELELAYQPITEAATGNIIGAEALVRWTSPELGRIGPDEFIPIAEKTGAIVDIGRWVLHRACTDAVKINACSSRSIVTSVNVSARQLTNADFVDTVKAALHEAALSPSLLKIELTETTLADDEPVAKAVIDELRTLGVKIVLDDFGTGYSALLYLQKYSFNQLKIDRAFVDEMDKHKDGFLLTEGIIRMAHSLRLEVVAEGVETTAQRNILIDLGCDFLQGYLISKPVPVHGFLQLLRPEKVVSAA